MIGSFGVDYPFLMANALLCACRRGHPTVEFIFSATEDGVFVHAIISAKY